jgi:hypothetical protein
MDETLAAPHSTFEIECRVLQLFCQTADDGTLREMARELLAHYRWSDATYQAIFELIMRLPQMSCQALRDQLPALLTRRGFPDFDFGDLFAVPAPSANEAEKWMRRLAERG